MTELKQPEEQKQYTGLNRLLRSDGLQRLRDSLGDGTFAEMWEDWKWIFSYSKKYRRSIACYLVLGVLSATLGLGASVASKYMIDIITNKRLDQLGLLALMMVGSTVVSLVFSSLVNRLSAKISIYVNNDIQADIFSKIIDADWMAINQYENGDLLNRFNGDIHTVSSNAVNWLPQLIVTLYTFVATFAVICYYDVTMALIALLSAPVLLLVSRFLMRRMREYKKKLLETNSSMMSFEAEAFYNFDTIKSFGITGRYDRRLREWQEEYRRQNLEYNLFSIKTNAGLSLLGSAVSLVAFGYCLLRLWTDSITYGTMTLFLQQRSKLSAKFESLAQIVPAMLNGAVSAHRVREIVELPKEVHDPAAAARLRELAQDGLAVRMRRVDFSYTEGQPVLLDSDFAACPGEIVAIVGPSGEGKTTLLRLVLGLIHPEKGSAVLVDSAGREVSMSADTRCLFSYVPQGNTMLSGTIAENMRMVREDATDAQIVEALKIACAWDFVSQKPEGIQSRIGERGRGVSEGQAQRLAIARAVLRDAPILLLDEATSALDVETERRVLRNIIRQRPDKTCIVCTHRPSVLSMCQRVYRVMDKKLTLLDEEASRKMVEDF